MRSALYDFESNESKQVNHYMSFSELVMLITGTQDGSKSQIFFSPTSHSESHVPVLTLKQVLLAKSFCQHTLISPVHLGL